MNLAKAWVEPDITVTEFMVTCPEDRVIYTPAPRYKQLHALMEYPLVVRSFIVKVEEPEMYQPLFG